MLLDETIIGRLIERPYPTYVLDPDVAGKVVLVTGAGGFIGSHLCKELAKLKPKLIILVEHCEFALYKIDKALQSKDGPEVVPVLSSYGTKEVMAGVFDAWQIDRVYHVGAYKHVPLVERNPVPAVMNNVGAFATLVEVMEAASVKSLVVVSSDKAVRPSNIMGCTKRVVEQIALTSRIPDVHCVRFGNVLWSSGSVLPLFYEQLTTTKKLTITHPDVDRYFMSVQQAVALILQSIAIPMRGSYVLDMGHPVKILQLAKTLAEEMLVHDYTIKVVGLRPGEKLHEELTLGESLVPTIHDEILYADEEVPQLADLKKGLRGLKEAALKWNVGKMRRIFEALVPGYAPSCGIVCDTFLQQFVVKAVADLPDCYEVSKPTVEVE